MSTTDAPATERTVPGSDSGPLCSPEMVEAARSYRSATRITPWAHGAAFGSALVLFAVAGGPEAETTAELLIYIVGMAYVVTAWTHWGAVHVHRIIAFRWLISVARLTGTSVEGMTRKDFRTWVARVASVAESIEAEADDRARTAAVVGER